MYTATRDRLYDVGVEESRFARDLSADLELRVSAGILETTNGSRGLESPLDLPRGIAPAIVGIGDGAY